MWTFLRKKLQKRIVFAVAIPITKEQFMFSAQIKSDFIKSLAQTFQTEEKNSLWKAYEKTAKIVEQNLHKFEKSGAHVIRSFKLADMRELGNYDVVVFIAHHSDKTSEIELYDKAIYEDKFVHSIPQDFRGIIDMSSCYSNDIQLKIKMYIPECRVLAVRNKVPLSLRMFMYDNIISHLCADKSLSYLETVKSSLDIISKMQGENKVHTNNIVWLGGNSLSSVFAPKQVEIGQPFLVQIAIHKQSESEDVEIMAKEVDAQTSLRNPMRLKLKLKKGDTIDIALKVDASNKDDVSIKRKRDSFQWENEAHFTTFTVLVSTNCKAKVLIGTLKLLVNMQPAGTITFKSDVVSQANLESDKHSAHMLFSEYDKTKEMSDTKKALLQRMRSEYESLEHLIAGEHSPQEKDKYQREKDICESCIQLLEQSESHNHHGAYRVFISSTSDMSPFRKVMEDRVLECSMYPEMYEKWPQKDKYPRDYCIEKVLSSDIFVCLLGANYGYIEPLTNTSMTEIELRVALQSGLPILIYVMSDYEKDMENLLPEHENAVRKQKQLIKELDKQRMVEFFSNEMNLALLASRELTLIQNNLER